MVEPTTPKSIFATRVRSARDDRGLSLDQLARAMRDAGRPISKASLVRLEQGDREPRLDEALALALVLNTSLAMLLSPSGKARVAITSDTALDGERLREWLRNGPVALVRGRRRSEGERTVDAITLAIAVDAGRNLEDALRADDKAGIRDALATLFAVFGAHAAVRDDDDG